MYSTHPDHQLKLSHQRIEKDRAFIVKEKMFKTDPDIGLMLNKLGNWMVAKGEQLRKHYTASKKIASLAFMQDQSGVFKA